jgi:hypothetical protein
MSVLHPFFFLWLCSPAWGLWPPRSRGFLITHNDAPQSVGLLWTSDQLVAETSTWYHTIHTTNIHAPGGIRTHDRRLATGAGVPHPLKREILQEYITEKIRPYKAVYCGDLTNLHVSAVSDNHHQVQKPGDVCLRLPKHVAISINVLK